MLHNPKHHFERFLLSPKGRWIVLVTGVSLFTVCFVILLNFGDIYRAVRLREWNITRFGCIRSLPRTPPRPSKEPLYISHNFHPKVGTGNLMFIYASMWGIAKKNGLTPTIGHTKLHEAFCLDLPPERFFDLSDCNNFVHGMEECCLYDQRTEHISRSAMGRNVSLWGYFQSWRYFHPEYEKDIRSQFAFKDDINHRADRVIEMLHSKNGGSMQKRPTVGIHIRRGDIMAEDAIRFGHTVPTREYFSHAIEYLENKGVVDPVFVVCTNDVQWSRRNLPVENRFFVENEGPYVDMAILTKMDHLILSTGTYSFFAAYLSSAKHVIYYKDWPQPDSEFARMVDLASFWLPEWIAMA